MTEVSAIDPLQSGGKDLMEEFQKRLDEWDYIGAWKAVQGRREWLAQHAAFELMPLAINYISEEQEDKGPHVVRGCSGLVVQLAEVSASPKECLITLIEHCEAFASSLKFRNILPGLAVVMRRLHDDPKAKQRLSLTWDWTLDTLASHVTVLPVPEMPDCLGNSEERLLIDSDPEVSVLHDTLRQFASFLLPLRDQMTSSANDERWRRERRLCVNHLVRTCMVALASPLADLNLEVHVRGGGGGGGVCIKSAALEIGETLADIVTSLEPDSFGLVEFQEDRFLKKDSSESDKADEQARWVLAVGVLLFVIHSDHSMNRVDKSQSLGLIGRLPCVHRPLHVLNLLLPSVNALMANGDRHLSAFKALDLANNLIERVPPKSVGGDILELDQHTEFLQKVIKVVVYNPLEKFRQTAFAVFDKYFELFSPVDGCYRLCTVLLEIANHSGLIGYVIGKIKDVVMNDLNGKAEASTQFKGYGLKVLVKKFARLSNGAETDLLEVSDELMAGINFLVCVCLRDRENATGIWDLKAELWDGFVTPLETGIKMSRAHYAAKLEEDDPVHDDTVSLQVGGQPLPVMNPRERKQVIEAALNTFAMLECVLIQLKDVIDKK